MDGQNYSLVEKIITVAKAKGVKLALAESCTGGMIAAAITDVPGSSDIFQGSAVTYSNQAKEDLLGVERDIIIKVGAVSCECAVQMAEGARRIYNAELALSVTGVAGPGGGTPEKPVGTVWFGYCSSVKEKTFVRRFSGTRDDVRKATVKTALEYLLKELL